MSEWQLVMVATTNFKPDGVQRGLIGEVIKRFEQKGFKLVGLRMLNVERSLAEKHYADLSSRPFFGSLVDYIVSGPVVAMVWEGRNVVLTGRKIIGATNPAASEPGTIRGDYAIEVGRNVIHGSDSVENAQKEIALCSRSARRLHSGTPGRTDTRCRHCVRSRAHKDVMSGVQQRMQLLDGLKDAVSSQDFARAAQMKRQLDELEAEDPILRLRKELKAAIEQEQYKECTQVQVQAEGAQVQVQVQVQAEGSQVQEAARLRTQLCELEAAGDVQPELSSLLTTSDTTTHGIRICVRSYFLPAHSLPHKDQWFFGYDVEMTNNSSQVVQLRHRHWVITDEKGETEEVRGPGVVGKQPVLLPRRSFTYSSHCHLRTSQGSMAGTFSFAMLNETDGMFSDPSLAVTVGRFKLSADGGAAL
ncbi:hypothetical protein QJQ45_003956 [Haematococcus lacustris]|nr:hypothetical protein QJQ45_003956 [Haematococcus lacustris]